jgi:hypothetical protein
MDTPPIIFNGRRFYKTDRYWISPHPAPTISLHRAVWEEAHGPIPDGYHIHHKDGDRDNNTLENLEMLPCTKHLSDHFMGKVMPKGEASPLANLTDAQALEIRALYSAGGVTQRQLAQRFQTTRATVSHVVLGHSYTHLPSFPPPPVNCPSHCSHGHEYTTENTIRLSPTRRQCRECLRIYRQRADAKRRPKTKAAG